MDKEGDTERTEHFEERTECGKASSPQSKKN